MCGRFTLTTPDVDAVAEILQATVDERAQQLRVPRFNAAPGQEHLILIYDEDTGLRLSAGDWGWRNPKGKFMVNARSETAHRLPGFARAFWHGRCAVVSD